MNEAAQERKYYPPVKEDLGRLLQMFFGDRLSSLHLEITATGRFSNGLKEKIGPGRDMIFSFLTRASPDITGCVGVKESYGESGFIIVEIKARELKLDDIYQAHKYADLFDARYGFLISAHSVPEELKRLSRTVYALLAFPGYGRMTLAKYSIEDREFGDWFPQNPFAAARVA